MITKSDLFKIGKLQKTHGIHGEITLLYDDESYAAIETDFYFFEIESTFVPFFIEEITFADDTRARVKFEDIEDELEASKFSNTDIYVHRDEIDHPTQSERMGWNFYVGFTVMDQNKRNLGIIDQIDTSTINHLFILKTDDGELLIPATDDFVDRTDDVNKIIYLNLPEGLID